jgi:hypothetical protein
VNPGLTIVHCLSCLNEIMVHFRALCCWLPGTHFTLSCASLAVCDMLLSISRSIPSSQPITRPAPQQISATENIPITVPPDPWVDSWAASKQIAGARIGGQIADWAPLGLAPRCLQQTCPTQYGASQPSFSQKSKCLPKPIPEDTQTGRSALG